MFGLSFFLRSKAKYFVFWQQRVSMISYLSGAIYLFVSFVDGALSDEVVGVVNTGTDGAVR